MLDKLNQRIYTYKYNDQYYVDVVFDWKTYEAWIYNKDYGVKDLMFGTPAEQTSLIEFLDTVNAVVPDYIESYYKYHEHTFSPFWIENAQV